MIDERMWLKGVLQKAAELNVPVDQIKDFIKQATHNTRLDIDPHYREGYESQMQKLANEDYSIWRPWQKGHPVRRAFTAINNELGNAYDTIDEIRSDMAGNSYDRAYRHVPTQLRDISREDYQALTSARRRGNHGLVDYYENARNIVGNMQKSDDLDARTNGRYSANKASEEAKRNSHLFSNFSSFQRSNRPNTYRPNQAIINGGYNNSYGNSGYNTNYGGYSNNNNRYGAGSASPNYGNYNNRNNNYGGYNNNNNQSNNSFNSYDAVVNGNYPNTNMNNSYRP